MVPSVEKENNMTETNCCIFIFYSAWQNQVYSTFPMLFHLCLKPRAGYSNLFTSSSSFPPFPSALPLPHYDSILTQHLFHLLLSGLTVLPVLNNNLCNSCLIRGPWESLGVVCVQYEKMQYPLKSSLDSVAVLSQNEDFQAKWGGWAVSATPCLINLTKLKKKLNM